MGIRFACPSSGSIGWVVKCLPEEEVYLFQNIPTGMYNSMISPLRNLIFKGALWYQGESNAGRPGEYEALLTAMLKDWRVKFADEDLPFFIMQLPTLCRRISSL